MKRIAPPTGRDMAPRRTHLAQCELSRCTWGEGQVRGKEESGEKRGEKERGGEER